VRPYQLAQSLCRLHLTHSLSSKWRPSSAMFALSSIRSDCTTSSVIHLRIWLSYVAALQSQSARTLSVPSVGRCAGRKEAQSGALLELAAEKSNEL